MKLSTDKAVLHVQDSDDPKDEIELLRNIIWLPSVEVPFPHVHRCVTVNCVFGAILQRMGEGESVPPTESMRLEMLRLLSFHSCPSVGKPYFILFAKAGFYFNDGNVICYVCGVCMGIDSWKETEDPSIIHQMYSPHCAFFRNNSAVNDPVPPLPPERMTKFKKLDNLLESGDHMRVEDVPRGDRIPSPKHPQYSTRAVRLASFQDWPSNKQQTPQKLATYGFFYTGNDDKVICFHCGIGLHKWEQDDLPAVEHFRLSRKCIYINQIRLEEMGREMDTMPIPALPSLQSGLIGADSGPTRQNINSDQLISDAVIQNVLDLGYPMTIIEAAIQIIRKQSGMGRVNAQEIMEAIFEIEEGKKNPDESLHSAMANCKAIIRHNPVSQTQTLPRVPKNETGLSLDTHGKSDSKEKFRYAYRTVEEFASSSSDEDDTYYDAVGEKYYKPNEGSSSEEDTYYDANEGISDRNESESSDDAKEVRPSPRTGSENSSRKRKSSRDTEEIKSKTRLQESRLLCKICMNSRVSIVFLQCGHLITCSECAPALMKCPLCRKIIKDRVKIYFDK